MKTSDGIVNDMLMREATRSVSNFDTRAAIAWMREREDTLGVFVWREAGRVPSAVREQGGILTDANVSTIERAVVVASLSAVTAVMLGHYRLWRNHMRGTALTAIDPLLSIRKRADPRVSPLQIFHGEEMHGGRESIMKTGDPVVVTAPPDVGETIDATRFRFVRCQPACAGGAEGAPLLAITSVLRDGTFRHHAIDPSEAESLLLELADSLAQLGSRRAKAAWAVLCSEDSKVEPLPAQSEPRTKRGKHK